MYPFTASFSNKITNNMSQELEKGHICRSTFLVYNLLPLLHITAGSVLFSLVKHLTYS
jgi:hypothetical protein